MPILGFPGTEINVQDQKKVSIAGLFNTNMFLLEMQDGYISDVEETKTGTGTVTPDGDVYADMNVVIEMVAGGNPGTATFKYSIDGGSTYSETITTTVAAMYLDNGLQVTFGGTAFAIGDKYEFFTKEGWRKRTIQKLTAKDYATKVTHKASKEILDAYFKKADECFVISPPNDVAGSIGANTGTVTGTGTIVIDGEPNRNGTLKIKFTKTGGIGVAEYLYYIDDVQMLSSPQVLAEQVYIKEANVTATFTNGGSGDSFVSGETYIYALTPAHTSNILLALTENISTPTPVLLNNVKMNNLFVNIVITTPLSTENMQKFKYLIDQRQGMNHFAGYILQAQMRGTLSPSAFKSALIENIQYFKDYRCCIVLDYMNTNTKASPVWTAGSVLLAQQIAKYGVNVDAGQVSNGALDVIERYDEDNMQLIELDLNNAGYTVIRLAPDSNGVFGYFFANTQVLSETGSKFKNYIDVRTFFKVLTIESYILNGYIKRGIVADDFVLRSLGETIQSEARAEMGSEVNNLTFEVISKAVEFKETGYIECRTTVDSVELINKFVVNALLD